MMHVSTYTTAERPFRILSTAFILAAALACGGGGASVAPALDDDQSAPAPTAPPPSTPGASAPAGSVVVSTTSADRFAPASVTVTPGSTVTWQVSGSRHNVTFGTLKPAGGDVPDTEPGNLATRTFAAEGTYPYQCTRHGGMTGQVIVEAGGGGGGGTGGTPPPSPQPGAQVQVTSSSMNPERVEIAPGSTVTWEFLVADGIIFEDDAPAGGNIPESPAGSKVSRTFTAEGDYDFSSRNNSKNEGRIRVR